MKAHYRFRGSPHRALVPVLIGMRVVHAQSCFGPGDLDRDTVVTPADFAILAPCIAGVDADPPPSGCTAEEFADADLDQDGDVDLRDFSHFALSFAIEYFDYGPYREDKEAEILAIEIAGELRARDREYNRIHRDLQLVREAYPHLVDATDHPQYAPEQLLVRLVEDAPRDAFDAFNQHYQVVDVSTIGTSLWHVLRLCDNIHPGVLGQIYKTLPEVDHAGYNSRTWLGCGRDSNLNITRVGSAYLYSFYYLTGDPSGWCCSRTEIVGVDEVGAIVPVHCTDSCHWVCP